MASDDDKPVVVTGHDSALTPKSAMAWALLAHELPDGKTWTVREQAQACLDFLHGNGYVIIKLRDLEQATPDITWTLEEEKD